MRKITSLLCSLVAIVAFAQFDGPGYYRVCNVSSEGYICIKGTKFNKTTNPDAFWPCILMLKDSAQVTDPGSIIYIPEMMQTSLHAQGVSTYSLTSLLLDVVPASVMEGGRPTYLAKTIYQYIPCIFRDYGLGLTAGTYECPESRWWIEPVNVGSMDTSYLAMKPVNEVADDNGWYWSTMCCDFPFLLPEEGGIEGAYTVQAVEMDEDGQYFVKPVKVYGQGDTVPAATPVLIKCASAYASGNKYVPVGDIANNTALPLHNDLLVGTYFSNFYNHSSFDDYNRFGEYIPVQAIKAAPERLALGVNEEGRVGFFPQAEDTYMGANTAWLDIADLMLEGVTAVYIVEETVVEPPVEEEYVHGDADGDGHLSMRDVSLVVKYLMTDGEGEEEEPRGFEINLKAADYDCDGRVSVRDISLIISDLLAGGAPEEDPEE